MKKSKNKYVIRGLVVAVILCITAIFIYPKGRVERFVSKNKESVEHSIENGLGLSIEGSWQYFKTWEGEHSMSEFIICSWGETYYGCYYSPDDVPLPFHNGPEELIPDGEDSWTWLTQNGKTGKTSKLTDKWY